MQRSREREFRFSSFGRTLVGKFQLQARQLDHEERADVEARLAELLFDYERGDLANHHEVERLHQELMSPLPQALPAADRMTFAKPPREHVQRVRRDLEAAVRSGRLSIAIEQPPEVRMARAPSVAVPFVPGTVTEEEPTFFEAALVDEMGEGIPGVDVVLTVLGERHELTSDGSGKVRLDGVFASFASLHVANAETARDALKPRWDRVREGEYLEENEETTVVLLDRDPLMLTLESEEPRTLSIRPHVVQAQLLGMFFDTNKNFLLPSALPSMKGLKQLYDRNQQSCLLVVGHTDTSGEPNVNDPLSLERADSVAAFLTDDVAPWLAMYDSGLPASKRWGAQEDSLMMRSVTGPDGLAVPNRVLAFQQFHNQQAESERAPNFEPLTEDGIVGPATRAQLIGDYMNVDGTTLPQGVSLVTHGCGENFPLDDTGQALDPDPENPAHQQEDRRVEVFFFDGKLGVQPPPQGKHSKPGSPEYPEWRRRAQETHTFRPGAAELISAHLSYLLRSNGSSFPLGDRKFSLHLPAGVIEGTTDAAGLVEVDDVPPDHYLLEIEGKQTLLAALPRDVERVPHTVLGLFLELEEPAADALLVAAVDPEEAAGLPPFSEDAIA